jgi:hypothetical protein
MTSYKVWYKGSLFVRARSKERDRWGQAWYAEFLLEIDIRGLFRKKEQD